MFFFTLLKYLNMSNKYSKLKFLLSHEGRALECDKKNFLFTFFSCCVESQESVGKSRT